MHTDCATTCPALRHAHGTGTDEWGATYFRPYPIRLARLTVVRPDLARLGALPHTVALSLPTV